MQTAYLDENFGRKLMLPAHVLDAHAQALRGIMQQNGLALLLIVEADTGGYRQWLTGVSTLDRFSTVAILIPESGPVWLINGASLPETEQSAGYRCLQNEMPYSYVKASGFCRQTLERLLAGGQRVGTVHGKMMSTALHTHLTQELGCELLDVTMEAERCKARKLPEEREAMRHAVVQTARLFSAAQSILEPELTQREVRTELRRCAYRLGCFGADNGISSSLTLHVFPDGRMPTQEEDERLHVGDCIGLHICCIWDDARYAVCARVFSLGTSLPAPMAALWATACDAQSAAAQAILPGTSLRTAADAANAVLAARGCCTDESRFLYAIGCARQERPYLLDVSEQWPLEAGTILVIAPTAAMTSGQRLCCADLFEVTASGCLPLVPLRQEPALLL